LTKQKFDLAWIKKKASAATTRLQANHVERQKAKDYLKKQVVKERKRKLERADKKAQEAIARVKLKNVAFVLAKAAQAALEGKNSPLMKEEVKASRKAAADAEKLTLKDSNQIHHNMETADKIIMERKHKVRKAQRQEEEAQDDKVKAEKMLLKERKVKGAGRIAAAEERSQKGKAMVKKFEWGEVKAQQREQKFSKLLARRRFNLQERRPFKESKKSKEKFKEKMEQMKRRAKRELKRRIDFKNWIIEGKVTTKERTKKVQLAKESVEDAENIKVETDQASMIAKNMLTKAQYDHNEAQDALVRVAGAADRQTTMQEVEMRSDQERTRTEEAKKARTRDRYATIMVKERKKKYLEAQDQKLEAETSEEARDEVAKAEKAGSVQTSNNKSLRKVIRKLDDTRRRAGPPGAVRRRRWVAQQPRELKTVGGVPVGRRRTSILGWRNKPPYTPIPIEELRRQVESQKTPIDELKQEVRKLQGRRRRTKEAALQKANNRADVWNTLAAEIKSSTQKASHVIEKRAAKAAQKAVRELSKATGVPYLEPPAKADTADDGANERKEKATRAGKKFREHDKALQKVLDGSADPKKRATIKKEQKKNLDQTNKDVKKKLEKQQKTPDPFPDKEPELLTLGKVKKNLSTQQEFQITEKSITDSMADSKRIYSMVNPRRRAYVARRRREIPTEEVQTNTEISDMQKSVSKWQSRWEKARDAAEAINPNAQSKKPIRR